MAYKFIVDSRWLTNDAEPTKATAYKLATNGTGLHVVREHPNTYSRRCTHSQCVCKPKRSGIPWSLPALSKAAVTQATSVKVVKAVNVVRLHHFYSIRAGWRVDDLTQI